MIGHLLGYHLTQVFLYISRIFPSFTPWVGRYAWWLANVETAVVDEGYKVLNFDCLVSFLTQRILTELMTSIPSTLWNGLSTLPMQKHAFRSFVNGWMGRRQIPRA
jgi:hypothetical protein